MDMFPLAERPITTACGLTQFPSVLESLFTSTELPRRRTVIDMGVASRRMPSPLAHWPLSPAGLFPQHVRQQGSRSQRQNLLQRGAVLSLFAASVMVGHLSVIALLPA